jgi:Uma2 family endonuclease
MLDVPAGLLAERKRLGHDRFDEMWEGELHMVPPPSEEHQRVGGRLYALLLALADEAGLHVRYETGLFDPSYPADESYRQPDLVVFDEAVRSTRGVEGAARLVIEIRSPGDETFQKQPFWERVGVAEVVVIDRDDKSVRRWTRRGDVLVEVDPAPDGSHHLAALEVTLATDGGQLVVTSAGTDLRI